MLKRSIDE
jgi:hypothetical protein